MCNRFEKFPPIPAEYPVKEKKTTGQKKIPPGRPLKIQSHSDANLSCTALIAVSASDSFITLLYGSQRWSPYLY